MEQDLCMWKNMPNLGSRELFYGLLSFPRPLSRRTNIYGKEKRQVEEKKGMFRPL
jgi:hypothetical protein